MTDKWLIFIILRNTPCRFPTVITTQGSARRIRPLPATALVPSSSASRLSHSIPRASASLSSSQVRLPAQVARRARPARAVRLDHLRGAARVGLLGEVEPHGGAVAVERAFVPSHRLAVPPVLAFVPGKQHQFPAYEVAPGNVASGHSAPSAGTARPMASAPG